MHSLEIKRREQITTALQTGCAVSNFENFCLEKQALWIVFKCYWGGEGRGRQVGVNFSLMSHHGHQGWQCTVSCLLWKGHGCSAAAAVCMRAWAIWFRQKQPRWCNPLKHTVWVSLAHFVWRAHTKLAAQQSCRKGTATGNWEAVKAGVRAVWNTNICGSVIYQYSWCLSTWSMRSFVKTKLCWVPRCLVLSRELP